MKMPWLDLTVNNGSPSNGDLKEIYKRAVKEADALYLLTAYLTDWPLTAKLNSKCKDALFIIGTDFGLTRKAALKKLLSWLPSNKKYALLAVDRGNNFHPKLLMWASHQGKCYIVVGSSNITMAGFGDNVEANVFLEIERSEFNRLRALIHSLRDDVTTPITESWIYSVYQEAKLSGGKGGKKKKGKLPVIEELGGIADGIELELPFTRYSKEDLRRRRGQQKSFAEINRKLLHLIKRCASSKVGNLGFYEGMLDLWGDHQSRFQGSGFHILGKGSDWHETCRSLVSIIDASKYGQMEQDRVVCDEIDRLKDLGVSSRGSWMSEMLCHFYPERYPVLNGPVRSWLSFNNYSAPRRSSEGARYIDMALKLRRCLKNAPRVTTLAEADTLIWRWKKLRDDRLKEQ